MKFILIVTYAISFASSKVFSKEILRPTCRAGFCDDRPECPETSCRCIFPSNVDCSVYYHCINGKPLQYRCSPGLLFNSELLSCDYSSNVNCSTPDSSNTTASTSDHGNISNFTQVFTTVESTVSISASEQIETKITEDVSEVNTAPSTKSISIETEQTENSTLLVSGTTILPTTEAVEKDTITSGGNKSTNSESTTEMSNIVSMNDTQTQPTATDFVPEVSDGATDTMTDAPATQVSNLTTENTYLPKNSTNRIENTTDISTTNTNITGTVEPTSMTETQTGNSSFSRDTTAFETISTNGNTFDETATNVSENTRPFTPHYSSTITEASKMTNTSTTITDPASMSVSRTNVSALTTGISYEESSIYDPMSSTITSTSIMSESSTETDIIRNISTTLTQTDSTLGTTRRESFEFVCPERFGIFPDPNNCSTFFHCSHFTSYPTVCPSNLHFNPNLQVCDWPSRAGCDSSIEIITTTEATPYISDTNTTAPCECDCCELPVFDDCSSYILCINHEGHKITCDEGLEFNPMTGTCDLKENVVCEPDIQCPSETGTFSYPHSCTHYLECINGTQIVKKCPEGLNFDPTTKNCSWNDCEGTNLTTTQSFSTVSTTVTQVFTKFTTRSKNSETSSATSSETLTAESVQNISFQPTDVTHIKTTANDTEVSETRSIDIKTTDASKTSSSNALITTKDTTLHPQETSKSNENSTVQPPTAEISVSDDVNTTFEARNITSTTTEQPIKEQTYPSNVHNFTSNVEITTISNHDITETENETFKISTDVTEIPQINITHKQFSTPTEDADTTLLRSTTITYETNSTEQPNTELEKSTVTQNINSTKVNIDDYSDKSTKSDASEKTETTTSISTKLTSEAVPDDVITQTTRTSEDGYDIITKLTNTKEALTTDYSEKTTEPDSEKIPDTSVFFFTTNSTDISVSNAESSNTEETTKESTISNTDTPRTTRFISSSIATKSEQVTHDISTTRSISTIQDTTPKVSTHFPTTVKQLEFSCPDRFGVYPDPKNCTTFYHCSQWVPSQALCPSSLHYNPELKVCDWPYRAGCGIDNHSTTIGERVTSEPEKNDTETCGCDCCELPIIGDCQSYILCIDHGALVITCDEGLYFNLKTSTCDLEENVVCETEVLCPSPSGKFPYPHSCKHYLDCANGTESVKKCPEDLNFDALAGNCSFAAECEDAEVSTKSDDRTELSYSPEATGITSSNDAASEIGTGETSEISRTTNTDSLKNLTTELDDTTASNTYITTSLPAKTENLTTDFAINSFGSTESTLLTSKIHISTKEAENSTIFITVTDINESSQTDSESPIFSSISTEKTFEISTTDGRTRDFREQTTLDNNTPKESLTEKNSEATTRGTEISSAEVSSVTKDITTAMNENKTSVMFSTTDIVNATSDELVSTEVVTSKVSVEGTSETDINNVTSKPITGSTVVPIETTEDFHQSTGENHSSEITKITYTNLTTVDFSGRTEISTNVTNSISVSTEESEKASMTTPEILSTEFTRPPVLNFSCPERFGLFPDPRSCFRFYHCSNWIPHQKVCPSKLHFNANLTVCDWPDEAGCVASDVHQHEEDTRLCMKCNDCFIQDDTNCSAYVQCKNGTAHRLRCPQNLFFNPKTTTCDDAYNVDCSSDRNTPCTTPNGLFPAENCTQFIHCSNNIPYTKECPEGLLFNRESLVCDWPENVDCGAQPVNPSTVSENDEDGANTTCDCECCLYPDENNCSSYLFCLDGKVHKGQCSDSLLFNPVIQNCDVKERVNCDGIPPMCLEPNGIIPNPESCSSFYKCSNGVPYLEQCDDNLHFDSDSDQCVEKCKAKCDKSLECPSSSAKPDSTTPASNALFPCGDPEGLYAVKGNCSSFYQCFEGKPYFALCPNGLHFNQLYGVCESPCDAKCDTTINCSSRSKRSFREDSDSFTKTGTKGSSYCPFPNGLYSIENDCTSYYTCFDGNAHLIRCPPGMHYSTANEKCEDPCKAQCNASLECVRNKMSKRISPQFVSSECTELNEVFPNPNNCETFYKCSNGKTVLLRCPGGQHFSPDHGTCKPPCLSGCNITSDCPTELPSVSGNCTCEDCFSPDPTDCSAYYFCKRQQKSKAYCPYGTLFNRISSMCEEEGRVRCEITGDPVMCPDPYGVFPYPGDCKKFLYCEDHVAHVRKCSGDFVFDPELGVCGRTKESSQCGISAVDVHCKKPTGIFPDVKNCSVFYQCENGVAFKKSCSFPLLFNSITADCDWPQNAACGNETQIPELLTMPIPTKNRSLSHETSSSLMSFSVPEVCHKIPGVICPCACRVPTYDECSSFYHCREDGKACKRHCPAGLYFNRKKMVCDLPSNVQCRDFFFTAINRSRKLKSLQMM